MGLYVLFSLVLDVVYLGYFIFQFLQQSKGVAFGIVLVSAQCVTDIVLVVSDEPDSILSLQFVSFVGLGSESLDFHGKLT